MIRFALAAVLVLFASGSAIADVVKAPAVPQPSQAGDVVGLIVQKLDQTGGYVTFGHVFKTGAVQPTDTLVAKIGAAIVPVQLDVKAKHGDGSVRHAVVTFSAASVSGSSPVMLAKGSAPPPAFQAGPVSVSTTIGTETVAPAAPTSQMWLSGPLIREWRSDASVMGGKLKVHFDVRSYADGSTCADVVYDNSWMFTPGKTDVQYDATVKVGGSQVFSAAGVYHYLYSMWHYDTCGQKFNVQYDVPYLMATGAVGQYDLSLGVDGAAIAADVAALATTAMKPLNTGLVTTYMPTTGGRPDIGPLTAWSSRWLLSQDAKARQVVLGNGDVAGAVGWSYRDENTDQPVSKVQYPNWWMDGRGSVVPVSGWGSGTNNPWTFDPSHMPELTYIPYLITGSRYRLDLLKFQAAYAAAAAPPDYQWFDAGKTLIAPLADIWQTRAYAWELRQVSMGAYAVPDGDPMQTYFGGLVATTAKNAVEWFITRDASKDFGAIKGFVIEAGAPTEATFAPWQDDFLATSYAQVVRMGLGQASTDAAKYLSAYSANFVAGRYLNGAAGFNPLNGAAYWIHGRNATGAAISTWAELQTYNVSKGTLRSASPPDLGELYVTGYPDISRGALAAVYSAIGLPAAKQAFDYVDGQVRATIPNVQAGWQVQPTFFFSPVAGSAPPPPPPPAPAKFPSVTLTVVPAIMLSGQPATLTWSSTDATSCSGVGFGTSGNGPAGSAIVKPSKSSTYGLHCSGPGGTTPTATVKVMVGTPPATPTQATGQAGSR